MPAGTSASSMAVAAQIQAFMVTISALRPEVAHHRRYRPGHDLVVQHEPLRNSGTKLFVVERARHGRVGPKPHEPMKLGVAVM